MSKLSKSDKTESDTPSISHVVFSGDKSKTKLRVKTGFSDEDTMFEFAEKTIETQADLNHIEYKYEIHSRV